jgi:glycine/D-amino acid oxidase-like deaminating enzyme
MSTPLEARYRGRSLWLDGLAEPLAQRPALAGDRDCDVAIVGAGFTGLWAAYFLASLQPDLRIAVVEREIAGFGPSGRNGGWASAGLAGSAHLYARLRGDDAVRRGERAMADAVGGIGRVIADEGIDCGWLHGGSLLVATSAPQVARLHEGVERRRAFGVGEEDLRLLEPSEIYQRVRVRGARAASYTPHCGRVDPARLARGLALACERRGVVIYEGTAATSIEPGRVRCAGGALRAPAVLRATEAFTVQQPGQRRLFMPLYSLMIATEPLPSSVWEELGWGGRETISDLRHLFFYAQRTPDDRIAIGGRGAPYRLGSPIDESYERNDGVRARLERTIAVLLGALRPLDRLRLGGRLHGPRRRHEQRARPHACRPGAATRHGARVAAVGRAREPALGARAASLPRLASDRAHARQRRPRRGPA